MGNTPDRSARPRISIARPSLSPPEGRRAGFQGGVASAGTTCAARGGWLGASCNPKSWSRGLCIPRLASKPAKLHPSGWSRLKGPGGSLSFRER